LSTGTSLENQSHTDEINEMVPALYLESNIYFSHKFIGVVGGRWEYASLSGKSILSPRVSLAYKTGEFSQISLASGLYHQRPDAQYLIYNKQLQDERAMHYILNFQYSRDQRTFRAEAYYKDYDQLV
jgi:outer membrane receptor for ferrienterochelin and colicin